MIDFSNQIIQINTINGQGTLVAEDVIVGRRLEDLAFHPNGDAYILTSGPRVYRVDILTGEKLAKWELNGAESLEGLLWHPSGQTLYSAADRNGNKDLVTISLSSVDETGTITFVDGPSGFVDIEALAIIPLRVIGALQEAYSGAPTNTQPQVPQRTHLHQNVPNPFNPNTLIQFEMAQAGRVEIAVYDVAGRRVVPLLGEHRAAGSHSVRWNGRTQNGSPAATGVYQYVMKTRDAVESQRMVLLK